MSDLHSSTSSDEQLFVLNQLNKVLKFVPNERTFYNSQIKLLDRTYTYIYDRSKCQIELPEIPRENIIISSLLSIRQLIVRIGVFYENDSTIQLFFGSDPANERLFSVFNPSDDLIEAKIIRRGLIQENMSDYDETKSNTTDLAILALDKPMKDLSLNECFDPQFTSFLSNSNHIRINSKLFLISYNGELTDNDDLNPYKYEKGFENVTIDKLNFYHNVNHKSVSIGRLIQESSSYDPYAMHSCSTLRGASGGVLLDSTGRFAGIHVGVANSRKRKQNEFFFNKDTFNKFIPVTSTAFQEFINQSIIQNIDNDELAQKWRCDTK
ncbi:hypothetical protein I4U23_027081 [Adineta vaga]|nr:hypothetical protein I4U23_027081 [Adineta vaga]